MSKINGLRGRGLVLVGLAASFLSGGVSAEARAEPKYAVVDMQAVILNVAEGKSARAKLETEIKAKEKELSAQKEALDKMNKEWQTQAAVLSEAARFKKQQEFQEKFLKLRNEEMTFQQDIKQKEQAATQKIAVAITQLVNNLAKEKGYEMVFETSSAGLVYLKDPVDITKTVIAAYEAKGSVAAKEDSAKKE